jgi:hypothetical protein
MSAADVVKDFLRAQNLEQLGRDDEAIELYEGAVAAGFDAVGPYDRLIALYSHRALHSDVIRVAEAALEHVLTYEDKKEWYRNIRREAERALSRVPQAAPKRRT